MTARVIDARPTHSETGLAGRAIEGQTPRMPTGLDSSAVAATICAAIAGDTPSSSNDLPSEAFAP